MKRRDPLPHRDREMKKPKSACSTWNCRLNNASWIWKKNIQGDCSTRSLRKNCWPSDRPNRISATWCYGKFSNDSFSNSACRDFKKGTTIDCASETTDDMTASARVAMVLLIVVAESTYAQISERWKSHPDSLLSSADSLLIFKLIDSLLQMPEDVPASSQLHIRLMYNSNVLAAGRTLGIQQFGLSPGITYYHKSGFFADVTPYWSRNFSPNYYLTIFSAGYLRTLTRHISVMAGYDRYEYRFDESFTPYRNSLNFTANADFTLLSVQVSYNYFFGDEHVHRIIPSATLVLEKKFFSGLDKVSFQPGISVLFGDAVITEVLFPRTLAEWIAARIRMRNGQPWYFINTYRVFGIMNYAFLFPLSVQVGRFTGTISYMYNIPQALPGEVLDISESGFMMAGLMYRLNLKSGN